MNQMAQWILLFAFTSIFYRSMRIAESMYKLEPSLIDFIVFSWANWSFFSGIIFFICFLSMVVCFESFYFPKGWVWTNASLVFLELRIFYVFLLFILAVCVEEIKDFFCKNVYSVDRVSFFGKKGIGIWNY